MRVEGLMAYRLQLPWPNARGALGARSSVVASRSLAGRPASTIHCGRTVQSQVE